MNQFEAFAIFLPIVYVTLWIIGKIQDRRRRKKLDAYWKSKCEDFNRESPHIKISYQ